MAEKRSHALVWPLLGLLLALSLLLSFSWGQMDIPFDHVLSALGLPVGAQALPEEMAVLWQIRLPRTLVALLVGSALAMSGAVLQGVFLNPLADPGIIGVSAGASAGAILAIGLGLPALSMFALPAFAFVGALLAVSLTIMLSLRRGRVSALAVLLSGVVVSMFLAAVTAVILMAVNEHKMEAYLFWTMGGLDYRRWEHVWLALGPLLSSAAVLLVMAPYLNLLSLGEEEARALGMRVGLCRLLLLGLATLATATAVSVSGSIGFVGLVVPHMMRLLLGSDHRRLLPASILAGGIFLVFCDALGRVLIPGMEIRVGIMTAFIGTPYFLYLLRREQQNLR